MNEPLFPPDGDGPDERDDLDEGGASPDGSHAELPWETGDSDDRVDGDGDGELADEEGDDVDLFDMGGHDVDGNDLFMASAMEEADQHRAVFVSTALPVTLRIAVVEDERAPAGMALGTFIGDRLVARCAMPREAMDQLLELELFGEPVPLGLLAVEEDPGLQCRLFALVPAERIVDEEESGPDEPWRSSVPSFEDAVANMEDDEDEGDDGEDGEDETAVASILLGHIVRFARDRKYADDLTAEAVDVLQKIVVGGQLQDANARAVDDLLDSL